jgi:hypothetical protein
MIEGHHTPHCYHAHVPGRGYVNDGRPPYDRADYLRQLEQAARAEVESMGYAPRYAEPGYDQPNRGVLFADWNTLPCELDSLLERAGYSVEWSDEWATCDACRYAIRTEPDGYDWEPWYVVDDSGYTCKACARDA